MKELLSFDKMVTPTIIRVVYFISLFMVLLTAVFMVARGEVLAGLLSLVIGAIFARVYCELLILLFRIYDKLCAINDKLDTRVATPAVPPVVSDNTTNGV